MSDPIASPAGEEHPVEPAGALQFDQAEFETPAADRPNCAVCHQPILEEYFEINGKVMCPRCRHGVEAAFRGGSRLARFLKATVFGMVAAVVGAVVYYASVRMTHYNLALISIPVGFLIGVAVRKGTGNRGGRFYQLLAVYLTYTSIGLMLTALNLGAAPDEDPEPAAAPAVEKPGPANQKVGEAAKANEGEKEPAAPRGAPPRRPDPLLLFLLAAVLVHVMPILDVCSGPIAGLIYAFALWEAWKINRPVHLVFNGPFRLGAAGPTEPAPEAIADGV